MATTKPRTNAKRPTASRSVRVTKKKQGVTKKQGFVAAAILALVGIVAVVASHASTAPNKVYVLSSPPSGTSDYKLTRVATDASSKSSYNLFNINTIDLSRDKLLLAGTGSGETITTLKASDGLRQSVANCPSTDGRNCNGRQKVWFPGNKRFAYFELGNTGSGTKTWAMNSDGTSQKVIFTDTGQKSTQCLAINKAGTKLLLSQYDYVSGNQATRFYTMNLDGSGVKQIAALAYRSEGTVSCPSWSPNGAKIAFVRSTTSSSLSLDVRVMNQDGKGLTTVKNVYRGSYTSANQITLNGMIDNSVWSPGSSTILYWAKINNVQNLYQVNVSTKKATVVTSNKSASTAISQYGWSSDGRIVYGYGPAGGCTVQGTTSTCTSDKATTVKSVDAMGKSARILYQATGGAYATSMTF